MPDTFAITIVFMCLCAVVAAFMKGRIKDRCLKSFAGDLITLDLVTRRKVWGRLIVENTGLELVYPSLHNDKDGHQETSFILYKYEYPNIQALVRFHDELDEKCKKDREKELQRTYHPAFTRRMMRKLANIFKTVRDSIMELVNLLITQAKSRTPAGAVLTSQDKYVSQMKTNMMGFVGTAFEPLLERHIGQKVVLELIEEEKVYTYPGVL